MVEIYIPRREGQYRHQCECDAVSESRHVFSDEADALEPQMVYFMNIHAGLGHSGVTEAWLGGRWVTGMVWGPMDEESWKQIDAMGGL